MDLNFLGCNEQIMNCRVQMKNGSEAIKISFVYGASEKGERADLWQHLRNENTTEPWLIVGDFNATLKEVEMRGTRSIMEPNT